MITLSISDSGMYCSLTFTSGAAFFLGSLNRSHDHDAVLHPLARGSIEGLGLDHIKVMNGKITFR